MYIYVWNVWEPVEDYYDTSNHIDCSWATKLENFELHRGRRTDKDLSPSLSLSP